ncbi:MAG: class 1 fructose-bisphosphatase [Hydrogenovibrio crunogenus]|uniref:Fructose-1,6-bisphosphatase class 1 n=1 Tax=Hydrogenovibrio crunogenus (strain DSM 25203 / XCL-2) TaxID=317025 RepID=F16PA_HYDCU|nr:RecName: Full=Fructose-1,6-bisphosphatase class 1; Short=FBPase class 1; AltName: Full=D-fructose-1,6-bisphosphate 1-phosphohydrolase class 1 [Hydrogenovibrio crunogenus XCL-2]MBD3612302.1 class 1 fructose-bisphosphatase [Hydrogenovibrio crunogenus]
MKRLDQVLAADGVNAELELVIKDVMVACKDIAYKLGQGELAGILGATEDENVQGETQKMLDVISNDLLKDILVANPYVRGVGSEEEDYTIAGNADGKYLVTFDPLDGSSNIDVNLSVGTIFSVLEAQDDQSGDNQEVFLQNGRKQVAAGYVLYGPSSLLVMTTGNGVNLFTLDTNIGEFVLTKEALQIPEDTAEFAINMSNQRFWEPEMKQYIDDCLLGEEGPLAKRYNMRWVASMVAEVHRILIRGGIFMYPYDNRDPSKAGKLRLMYEGNPMSMIVEQAGGASSTGRMDIMDVAPQGIHDRVPVVLGSKNEVAKVVAYHTK